MRPTAWLKRASRAFAALSLMLTGGAALAAEPAGGVTELLLSIGLNGEQKGDVQVFLRDAGGRTFASGSLLESLRIDPRGRTSMVHDGETYYLLAGNGIEAQVFEADQSIMIQASADAFQRQRAEWSGAAAVPMTESGRGLFFNYDLIGSYERGGMAADGAFDLGFFSRLGVGTASFVGNAGRGKLGLTRLETNWTIDRPDSMTSLRFGDSVSRGGQGVPPVRFAGVQYGRNFAVQPGYVTMPLPTMEGSAAVPSVIDVVVNNVNQGSQSVEAGPFSLSNVPLQSGGGSLQLVVRDMLGRETVTTQNYYASSQLLRKGLRDFSYEIGFLRHDFGVASNRYGTFVASTTQRYGLSDKVTLDGVAQATRKQQLIGGGVTAIAFDLAQVSASANLSRSSRGLGHSFALGVERSSPDFSFGARAELASTRYAYAGAAEGERAPRLSLQAYADMPLLGGSIGANYLYRSREGEADQSFAGIHGSVELPGVGLLQLYARRTALGRSETSIGAHLSFQIGGRNGSAGVEFARGKPNATLTMQRDLPVGTGTGYRSTLTAGGGSGFGFDSEYSFNSDTVAFTAQAARREGQMGVRAGARGSLGLIGGRVFAARRLGDSFAAVRVPGVEGVRVYADNQLIGRTDRNGNLIVPAMRAYEGNRIRVDEADFPLDVTLGATERVVRPFAKSGSLIEFSVKRNRGALLKIKLEDGRPLPTGAMVKTGGDNFVTVDGGEVYVDATTGRMDAEASWTGGRCALSFMVPDNDDPQPLIDGLVCRSLTYAAR